MRLRMSWRPRWTGGALLLLLAAAPAAADWLVTAEGGRVETKGTWKVKGKLVVFETKDGALASLRLTEVDLEASAQVTQDAVKAEEAKAQQPENTEPARRKSVRVITDADVAHVEPAAPPAEEAGEGKEDDAGKEPEPRPRGPIAAGPQSVVVDTWERLDLPDKTGIEVVGELENKSDEIATGLQVVLTLLDGARQIIVSNEAQLTDSAVRPGGRTRFRVVFPGTFSFAEASFDVRANGLKVKAAPTVDENAETPP